MVGFWTENRVSQLQDLWHRNSASEIAAVIGTSRNAVLGKAHRLGLDSKQLLTAINAKPKKQMPRPRVIAFFSTITQTPIATRFRKVEISTEPTKNELRAMLRQAVVNTGGRAA